MATSYSDFMNSEYSFPHDSESKLLYSSLGGAQTTIAALENNAAPTHANMFYITNHPNMTDTAMLMQHGQVGMNDKDAIVASQYVQSDQPPHPPASFHHLGTNTYGHVTPAPVVKSQAGLPGQDGAFYTQPTGLGLSFPQSQAPMATNAYPFLQQDPAVMNDYRVGYPPPSGEIMMAVAATSTTNCFPQPDAVPPGMVSPSSMVGGQSENSNPAPMMMLLMGEDASAEQHKMTRRQSSTNLTDQQARAGKGLSRRPMPRRHTVSTPYHDGNASKIVKQDHAEPVADARLRKLLKSKKHRSLGRLDLSNLDARAWMSPETATPSPSSVCSPILPGHAAILDHERQAWDNQQSRAHDYFEWDHVVKSQAPPADETTATPTTTTAGEDERMQCLWKGCDMVLANLESLIAHVKEVHIGSGKPLYFCEWKDCPRNQKPFSKRHKMHNHLRTHTGERPFECTEPGCNKRFSRPDSLTTHLKIHSNVRPYLCEYEKCGKAYYHLRSLRKHERSHETTTDDGSTTTNQDDHRAATLAALSGDTVVEWPM